MPAARQVNRSSRAVFIIFQCLTNATQRLAGSRAASHTGVPHDSWRSASGIRDFLQPSLHRTAHVAAQGLPFCVAGTGDLLALFRCISCRYCFGTNLREPAMLGAPGRVFATTEVPGPPPPSYQHRKQSRARVRLQRWNTYCAASDRSPCEGGRTAP